MSDAWKAKERLVASWFGSHRNPLSGRNNVDDSGQKRVGDIVYPHGVVEVKSRRMLKASFAWVNELRTLAGMKPWLLVEFVPGKANVVRLTMEYADAQAAVTAIKTKWEER